MKTTTLAFALATTLTAYTAVAFEISVNGRLLEGVEGESITFESGGTPGLRLTTTGGAVVVDAGGGDDSGGGDNSGGGDVSGGGDDSGGTIASLCDSAPEGVVCSNNISTKDWCERKELTGTVTVPAGGVIVASGFTTSRYSVDGQTFNFEPASGTEHLGDIWISKTPGGDRLTDQSKCTKSYSNLFNFPTKQVGSNVVSRACNLDTETIYFVNMQHRPFPKDLDGDGNQKEDEDGKVINTTGKTKHKRNVSKTGPSTPRVPVLDDDGNPKTDKNGKEITEIPEKC